MRRLWKWLGFGRGEGGQQAHEGGPGPVREAHDRVGSLVGPGGAPVRYRHGRGMPPHEAGPPPVLHHDRLFEFRNPRFLEEALTHSTYALESSSPYPQGNERLEFLGDAVLGLITSLILMESYPDEDEGGLTQFRSFLVNKDQLAHIAREMGLGRRLLLGKGEERTGGREKDTILADALEALIGAVFLDRGLDETTRAIHTLFGRPLRELERGRTRLDAKSALQEKAQNLFGRSPSYYLVREAGPAHNKTFITQVKIGRRVLGEGSGKSKKESQQRAAERALERIMTHRPPQGRKKLPS